MHRTSKSRCAAVAVVSGQWVVGSVTPDIWNCIFVVCFVSRAR